MITLVVITLTMNRLILYFRRGDILKFTIIHLTICALFIYLSFRVKYVTEKNSSDEPKMHLNAVRKDVIIGFTKAKTPRYFDDN